MVLDDGSNEFNELKNRLQTREFIYIPYLGKNDHFAKIDDVIEVELRKAEKDLVCISLIKRDIVTLKKAPRFRANFFYEEYLPVRLKEKFLIYEYEKMVLSSWGVGCESEEFFEYEGRGIDFF